MYQLVSAVVKPLTGSARWGSLDIGNIPLTNLFAEFKKVVAVLSNPFLSHNVAFDIEAIRGSHGGYPGTFNQFLQENGNKTLHTSDELPTINTHYAKYADAFHAGYKITPSSPTASSTAPVIIQEKTDLLLTKSNIDYHLFYRSCLVNVNGFYHKTDASDNGVYVIDGMKSCLKSNRNECGILNFLQLGSLEFIPITDEMIYKQSENQELKNNCYVDTGIDLSDKTVMLVLGGYLHVLDKRTFYRVSGSAFGIDFSNLPLVDRYYESAGVLDLSSLGMEKTNANPEQISVPNLFSDAVLRKYLTLSQSFFVAINNKEIFVERKEIKSSPYPGVYTSFILPEYPVVIGAGRHETPWYRKEHDRYSLQFKETWTGQRNYNTVDQRTLTSVGSANVPIMGFRNLNAEFMLIGADL